MSQMLTLQLKLERTEVVRGESAPFTMVLQNNGAAPVADVPRPSIHSDPVWIDAVGPSGKFQATLRTRMEREGVYSHGPRDIPTMTLQPREKLDIPGDVLIWFGELPPGTYQLKAYFEGPSGTVAAPPVPLRIWPADPVAMSTPRLGETMPNAELAGTWTHKFAPTSPDAGKFCLFFSAQSHLYPKSPLHGIRAALLTQPVDATASTLADAAGTVGHVLWPEGRGLTVAAVNLERPPPTPPAPTQVRMPYAGELVQSPMTDGEGTLWIPWRDPGGSRLAVIRSTPDEPATAVEAPIGQTGPAGVTSFFWEYDARLHLAWTKPRGREIHYSRLDLGDLEGGFGTPVTVAAGAPVIWIEGFLDAESARLRNPKAPEAPEPDPSFYVVTSTNDELSVIKINMFYRQASKVWATAWPNAKPADVVHAVVMHDKALVLLVRTADDQYSIVDVGAKRITPVREAAGITVTAAHRPALLAASKNGVRRWLFLRTIDRSGAPEQHRVALTRLQPADAPEPVPSRPPKEAGVPIGR